MSYFNQASIDTRTCGQADEDARLDARDGYRAYTRDGVFAGLAAQRHSAAQASREQPTLDPRSVLLVALRLREEGDEQGARSIVAAYRASLKGAA